MLTNASFTAAKQRKGEIEAPILSGHVMDILLAFYQQFFAQEQYAPAAQDYLVEAGG